MQTIGYRFVGKRRKSTARSAASGFVVAAALCIAGQTRGQGQVEKPDAFDEVGPVPNELRGVDVTERTGAQIPLDMHFIDETGKPIVLERFFAGDVPVILTFNYSKCPMLCSLQLSSLVSTLKKTPMIAGQQFRIVTIGLDPNESTASIRATKKSYVSQFDELADQVQVGWHFLRGTKENIRALADQVGFGYRYLPKQKDYAHSTALILVSASGIVTNYIKGIHYQPDDLVRSIASAGMNQPGPSLGFVLSCFQYDSSANSYSGFASRAMRWGGSAFAVAVLFSVLVFLRRHRRVHHALTDVSTDAATSTSTGEFVN